MKGSNRSDHMRHKPVCASKMDLGGQIYDQSLKQRVASYVRSDVRRNSGVEESRSQVLSVVAPSLVKGCIEESACDFRSWSLDSHFHIGNLHFIGCHGILCRALHFDAFTRGSKRQRVLKTLTLKSLSAKNSIPGRSLNYRAPTLGSHADRTPSNTPFLIIHGT